jgi:VIT1/CCC1 family predicted Fe2+/Mn2+ transporter
VRSQSGSPLAWAVGLLVPEDNPARHVDGVILTGALLAVESTRRETLAQAAGAVAIVIVLLWLSHSYAETVAERLKVGRPLSAHHIWNTAVHELALLRGAFVPLVVLLLADLFGRDVQTAVVAALVSAVVLLFLIELVAALRAHLSWRELATQVCVGGLLGAGVLGLHLIWH